MAAEQDRDVPEDAITVHTVLTLKREGDFPKIKEHLRRLEEETKKEAGCVGTRALIKEGESEEKTTHVLIISGWKDESAWKSHFEMGHTREFFANVRDFQESFENFRLDKEIQMQHEKEEEEERRRSDEGKEEEETKEKE